MNLRDIKGLMVIGEKKVFGEIAEIISISRKADAIMTSMLTEGNGKDRQSENEDIRLLEKKSDDLSFSIKAEVTNGAISSNIIDNLLECVEMADSIMDDFYYISREMNRLRSTKFGSKGSDWLRPFNSMILSMLKLADNAMEALISMLMSGNLSEMKNMRKRIEELEEQGDNIKDTAFDMLYGLAADMHYLQFNHVSDMVHKMDDILDGCEDVSDLVLAVATSISK
ncbi:MAG: DUF47 family protein [Thermoplasmata archaeon]|nr:DUF47 family protein [Candidatus Sysuiplasma acidicola]MBX8646307.1 DUF47 family protein [Candidatus Sysuiplasma acidicola]